MYLLPRSRKRKDFPPCPPPLNGHITESSAPSKLTKPYNAVPHYLTMNLWSVYSHICLLTKYCRKRTNYKFLNCCFSCQTLVPMTLIIRQLKRLNVALFRKRNLHILSDPLTCSFRDKNCPRAVAIPTQTCRQCKCNVRGRVQKFPAWPTF